jgi:hypothetical protein
MEISMVATERRNKMSIPRMSVVAIVVLVILTLLMVLKIDIPLGVVRLKLPYIEFHWGGFYFPEEKTDLPVLQ